MKPLVSIIMGSTSDLPVMEKACKWLEEQEIPFEMNALSAHRTPDAVEQFAKGAKARGVKVILFRLDRRLGAKAAFVRNDRLLALKPVEAVICEGSGIQMNLAQKLRQSGVPLHVVKLDSQAQRPAPQRQQRSA